MCISLFASGMLNIPQPIQDLMFCKVHLLDVDTYYNMRPFSDEIMNQIDIFRGLFKEILRTCINNPRDTSILYIPHQTVWYNKFIEMHEIADTWQTPQYYHSLVHDAYEKYVAVLEWLLYDNNIIVYAKDYRTHILSLPDIPRQRRARTWAELASTSN